MTVQTSDMSWQTAEKTKSDANGRKKQLLLGKHPETLFKK